MIGNVTAKSQGQRAKGSDVHGWSCATTTSSSSPGVTLFVGAGKVLVQRYCYTGRELNSESGEYYFRYRTYGPDLGQFFTRDPLGYDNAWSYISYLGLDYQVTSTTPVVILDLYGGDFAHHLLTDPMGEQTAWEEDKLEKDRKKTWPGFGRMIRIPARKLGAVIDFLTGGGKKKQAEKALEPGDELQKQLEADAKAQEIEERVEGYLTDPAGAAGDDAIREAWKELIEGKKKCD